MDKSSDNQKSYILLLDDLAQVKNKIKSAVTDSDGHIAYISKTNQGSQIYSLLMLPSCQQQLKNASISIKMFRIKILN